jgi:FtsP/CotA-like multicopper oxidase with cupredoxin domain
MTAASVNIHYHGTNTPPVCHQDEVIHTLINSGQSFRYEVVFPKDEPAGLYWYHPHVHGISVPAVQGGASGAIIVDGIQNYQPEVRGLRHRVLLVRDQIVAAAVNNGPNVPARDLTLNNVPISYPQLIPAVIQTQPVSADTILDVQLIYDGIPQTLSVVGIDGVPIGSQEGKNGNAFSLPLTLRCSRRN